MKIYLYLILGRDGTWYGINILNNIGNNILTIFNIDYISLTNSEQYTS